MKKIFTTLLLACVFLFNASAQIYKNQWGVYGTGQGQFSSPQGVAIDGSGNLYVADKVNRRIQKFNASGGFVTEWNIYSVSTPTIDGIAVDGSGNVYVAEAFTSSIHKYTSTGTYISQVGAGYGAGNGQLNKPTGIAVDGSGNLYVADADNFRVQKFNPSGAYVAQWGSSANFQKPRGIAIDPSTGEIYVTDEVNNNVQKFNSAGTYISQWGASGSVNGKFTGAAGIAVDAVGNVYVVDKGNNRIQKFAPDGTYLSQWGVAGTGNGQFSNPHGIVINPLGDVLIMEEGNNRGQVFCFPPPAPGTIMGLGAQCPNVNGQVYSISAVGGALGYTWGVPTGWTIVSGQGTTSITVNTGLTGQNGNITVTADNACGSSMQAFLNAIVNPNPSTPTISNKAICAGDPAATFDAGAGYVSYFWSGSGSGTTQVITGGTPGNYVCQVTNSYGCKASSSGTLTVNALPLAPSIANQTICIGDPAVTFDAGVGYTTYLWSGNASGTMQTVSGALGGNYTCMVTNANGCKAFGTGVLIANTLPAVNFTLPDNYMCINAVTIALSGGMPIGGIYSGPGVSAGNFDPTAAGIGVKSLTYTYTDGNGCKNAATDAMTVNALPTPFLPNQTICAGDPAATFDAGVFNAYLWSANGTGTTQTNSGTTAGNYTVQVMDINGCVASATGVLTVNPLPVVNLTSFSSVCKNDAGFPLTGGSPAGGAYSGTGVVSTNFDPKTAGIGTFNITYTYVDVNQCSSSKTTPITVTNHADIHGYVTYGTDTVKSGWVILFADSSSKVMWDTIRSTAINPADGSYTIDGVLPRKYILQALPDPVDYPNLISTYHDGKFNWDSLSAFVSAPCIVTGKNIPTIELFAIPTGTAVISGYVYSDGSLKTNDPIPGLDIILDKIPPSQTVQKTTTDANGHYVFNNLPSGTYQVNIDVTGVGVDSLYSVSVADNDSTQNNLDYCIDSTVYLCSAKTSVAKVKKNSKIKMWPNPTQNQLMIQLPEGKEMYSINIFDLVGNTVFSKENVGNVKLTEVDFSGISEGIYIVKIASENTVTERKIIKQ